MRTLKRGDKIQLERRGYFVIDNVEMPGDKGKPMKLVFIPDGKKTNMTKNIKGAIDQKDLAKSK
jgi:glutamyl-tRNA synthetase